jgi:hypothetical protein
MTQAELFTEAELAACGNLAEMRSWVRYQHAGMVCCGSCVRAWILSDGWIYCGGQIMDPKDRCSDWRMWDGYDPRR